MTDNPNTSENSMEKISEILKSRPRKGQFRDQVFWLVDIINACKASNNRVLTEESKIMEKALGDLGKFLETGEVKEIENATRKVEQFARIIKAVVAGKKPEFNIFLSYSTDDADFFKISEIARQLEDYPDINKVFYWQKDSGQNIIEYMETFLEKSRVFILFCSPKSKESKSVKLERGAAIQLSQEERMRIIPVFINPLDIPLLIKPFLGVEYPNDLDKFIPRLYEEVMRN